MKIGRVPFLHAQAVHRPFKRPAIHTPVSAQQKHFDPPPRTAEAVNQRIFKETLRYIQEHPLPPLEIAPSPSISTLPLHLGPTEILLVNASTFQTTQGLVQRGYKPLVLDMANATRAGGNVLMGSNAQEETLCRQSNLFSGLQQALRSGYYPLAEGFLVKHVSFFRNDYYAFLKEPFQADVFVSAAYDCNPAHKLDLKKHLRGYDRPATDEAYVEGTKAKMRALCRSAKCNGNDSLVLGAFGCGAFQNDPIQIAQFYKEVLNEPEFQGAFKIVAFGIPKGKNLDAFQGVFAPPVFNF